MSLFLVPALEEAQALFASTDPVCLPHIPESPFHRLAELSRTEMADSRGMEAADATLCHYLSVVGHSSVPALTFSRSLGCASPACSFLPLTLCLVTPRGDTRQCRLGRIG